MPASLGHQARGAKSKSDTLSDKLLLVTHGEIGKEARVAISDSGANVTHVSLSEFNSFDTPHVEFHIFTSKSNYSGGARRGI